MCIMATAPYSKIMSLSCMFESKTKNGSTELKILSSLILLPMQNNYLTQIKYCELKAKKG